jgi:hypothetical protein
MSVGAAVVCFDQQNPSDVILGHATRELAIAVIILVLGAVGFFLVLHVGLRRIPVV